MSNSFTTVKTESFEWTKIDNTNRITIEIKEGINSYHDILNILRENPGYDITIYNIYSYSVFNLLIALLSRIEYDGTVTLDLVDGYSNMDDLEKHEILDLFNIPSYVKIKGFLLNNEQNAFSTWAHNQAGLFKETLAKHLASEDKKLFESQEEIIKSFYNDYGKRIELNQGTQNTQETLNQICRFIKERITLDRNLSLDEFTGNFAKFECAWAENPVEIYKRRKGTSDGIVHLLTLLSNNSIFGVDCVPVSGHLANGNIHIWNEFIDSDNNIYHYDCAFNIEGLPDTELAKCKERTIDEEYPWVKSKRPVPAITYTFKPSTDKEEEK